MLKFGKYIADIKSSDETSPSIANMLYAWCSLIDRHSDVLFTISVCGGMLSVAHLNSTAQVAGVS